MILNIIWLVVAIVGVVKSADWFLQSVEKIGLRFKLPPFILGVVLVGFGTSLPELATSVSSILNDTHNVAIANIIGSNVANVLLVIGLSTLFLGVISFKKNLIDLDLPHLFGVSVLFAILIADGSLNLYDGLFLAAGFIVYLIYSLSQHLPQVVDLGLFKACRALISQQNSRRSSRSKRRRKNKPQGQDNMLWVGSILVVSLILLAVTSRLAIINLLSIAQIINLQVDIVTFVTIALGTSLPELLVTFKALRKGQGDLVLGNIVGSSVFNILLVGGVAALMHPQTIDSGILGWSIVGLLLASLILLFNGITQRIRVWEGAIFILIYIAFITKIVS